MEPAGIACIVMAAGASSRFGGDKLAAQLGGRSLLRRALEAVPPGLFSAVAVVTARPEGAALCRAFGFTLVPNHAPEAGVSRTIRLGLDAAGPCAGALFLVSDQPLLRRETVERLVSAWQAQPEYIVCAAHDGARGNPCLFPARFFPELRALTGDTGGGAVIRAHPESVRAVELPAAELLDADTPQALAELERLYQARRAADA